MWITPNLSKMRGWGYANVLYIQGQRSISRSNMIFLKMRLGTSVIPYFHVILTGKSISEIISIIQGHLQGQKVNFKVK